MEKLYSLEKFESLGILKAAMIRRDLSDRTYRNYLNAIRDFMETLDIKDLDRVIKRVKAEELDPVELLKQYVDGHMPSKFNGKADLSRRTLALRVSGLKQFFRTNGVRLYNEETKDLLPRTVRVPKGEGPSRELLIRLLQHLKIREKVMLTLASGSGLRMGTIVKLQIKDIPGIRIHGEIVLSDPETINGELIMRIPYSTMINGRTVKKMKGALTDDNRKHTCFITPQAAGFIEEYLTGRIQGGEELRGESPLLTLRKDGQRWESQRGDFLTYFAAWKQMRRALKKVKADDLHPHTFRAYFRTQLNRAGVSDAPAERLMAHKGGYMQMEYYAPRVADLRKAYAKALPLLELREESPTTLSLQGRLESQNKEIVKLKRQNQALNERLDTAILELRHEDHDAVTAKRKFYEALDKLLEDPERRAKFMKFLETT